MYDLSAPPIRLPGQRSASEKMFLGVHVCCRDGGLWSTVLGLEEGGSCDKSACSRKRTSRLPGLMMVRGGVPCQASKI